MDDATLPQEAPGRPVWSPLIGRFRSREPRLAPAERVAHWLAVAGCVFFAAVAFWESFGPPRGGHMSTSAAYSMAGENMVHWHKFAVYNGYLPHPANPDQYYCHHPYGISVLQAIAYLLLGHHSFTTRAGAIFCSVISAPLVYAFGRKAWGVIPAAVATLFFVFVPINLSFINFSNLEWPTIAFGLLFTWGTAHYWETSKTRHLVAAVVGALGCCNGDWVGLIFIGTVVGFGFVRAYVLPRRWYGRIDDRSYAKWFAYATAMALGTLVAYLLLFGKADKIGDMMGSYHMRSAGADATVVETFSRRRKLWLGVMFTPIAYGALGVGMPLAVIRLVKKPLEIFAIAWMAAASFQYFVFKQGADIHIFWPHYYAPTTALAAGAAVATFMDARGALVSFARRLLGSARARGVAYGTAAFLVVGIGVPVALLARMGLAELVQSRKTGGRFDQGGAYVDTEADASQFAQWAYSNVATAGSTAQALEKFDYSFHLEYAGDRPYVRVNSLTAAKPEDPQRIAVVNTRNQPVKELESIARRFAVQAVGPFWRVDRAQKGPSFKALEYTEREPNAWQWMFVSGTDLVRTISRTEDEYASWEWRDALGLPNTVPTAEPVTPEELRIAHNIAVSEKDSARAEELRTKLAGMVGRPLGLDYTGGTHLLGVDIHKGPAIVVTLFWETDDTFKRADSSYEVKCTIVAPPRLWFTNTDYFDKQMAPIPIIRPSMWKPGYLYTQRFIADHRIGKEKCTGSFPGTWKLASGGPDPLLFTLD